MGTNYSGFQVQDNANTIQSEVEKALSVLFRVPFQLTGSSRTDAGVHALQNFFHFDTGREISGKVIYNLNAVLPPDISAKAIYSVTDEAHSRFDACSRTYRYIVYRVKDPFLKDRAYYYPFKLDFEMLSTTAGIIISETDFVSFSKRNTQVKNFVCSVEMAGWTNEGDHLIFTIRANRFLRGMVRGLVGTMLKTGRGFLSVSDFQKIFELRDCRYADFSAPAHGLFLQQVEYPAGLLYKLN